MSFSNITFAHPWWFLLLLAIPLLLFLESKKKNAAYIEFSTLSILGSLGSNSSQRLQKLKFIPIVLAIISASIALANPLKQQKAAQKLASGIDIMIALDISLSMKTPDFVKHRRRIERIDAAHDAVRNFIKARPSDRIGIVSFAGRPYYESSITLQHDFLLTKLPDIVPNNLLDDGTAIGSAIIDSASELKKHKDTKSRIILLLTDGSSNTGKADPITATNLIKDSGIKIYTIGIGTEQGRLSAQAFPQQEFDTKTLEEIAKLTSGEFFRAKTTEDLEQSFSSIDGLEKTQRTVNFMSYNESFHQYFTMATLAFASLAITLSLLKSTALPE